ncbi:uncharacterized protein EI97DRAFT_298582 [Westerdykella ornata]|uniref:Uncharacterized protein n=1 Tax=Westerdykella ornata TaxID=318751 RepID=A0A6A6JM61_WESOR|nr:uncharacterized protein EI97DRAFT_298582 [Westerdykella ornata]KAF2277597.1 hypothetical protein EI97DRAFT_298582 [Westerdykella ornata]
MGPCIYDTPLLPAQKGTENVQTFLFVFLPCWLSSLVTCFCHGVDGFKVMDGNKGRGSRLAYMWFSSCYSCSHLGWARTS